MQFARTAIDGATTVRDVTGTVHFVSDGRTGQFLLLVVCLTGAATAVHLLVRSVSQGQLSLGPWAVLAMVVLVAEMLRPERSPINLFYAAITVLVVIAASHLELTPRQLSRVGWVTVATAVSLLLYSAAFPERGWAPCRPDKCSPAGGLLVGYFPQENVVAMFLAALTPSLAYIRRPVPRHLAVLLVVACVLLTGSRTSVAALLLGIWSYVILRRRAHPDRQHGDASMVVGVFPVVAFAASAYMLFTLTDRSLTGRGLIFRIVREAWARQPLLGPGRGALEDAYYSSVVNWYVAHEHGQAAYILAQAGLLGGVALLVALLGIATACALGRGPLPAVFALVPALGFLTEPTWEITVRSPYFATLALTIAFCAATFRGDPVPSPSRRTKAPDSVRGKIPLVPKPAPEATRGSA